MKNIFPLKATFIDEVTYDLNSQNWSKKEWKKDLHYMKKIGIDTLVFIRAGFYNKTNYPTNNFPTLKEDDDEDLVEIVLSEADKNNMNVYVGLYISDLCWGNGDIETEIAKNKIFIKEAVERYGHHKSFIGWYIPHEVGNDIFNIKELMLELGKMLREATPNKKIMISPFFHSPNHVPQMPILPDETEKEWDKIFKVCGEYIDVCAFQDGIEPEEMYEDYFTAVKRVCDKYDIELWANCETFDPICKKTFYPISFELLRYKVNKAKPFVSGYITFEFSHFMSPQSMFVSAKHLYKRYCEYYKKHPFNK